VLRELALGVIANKIHIQPRKVISVAEVLEPLDKQVITRAFGSVHQVYQATEGFLGSTCEHGSLHLNEEYVHIEPHWLDKAHRRFSPIITDFSRLTQPFVRYLLDDVLVGHSASCPCGLVTRAIETVEGRSDDRLVLPGRHVPAVTVFADLVARVLAQHLPHHADYRLVQTGPAALRLHGSIDELSLAGIKRELERVFTSLGVIASALSWELRSDIPPQPPGAKLRRIISPGSSANAEPLQ
jgi:putative adenylate-forming enzyme